MWLPDPIYKRAPQFWLLIGLLFLSAGIYLGFERAIAFVYFGVGFFSIAWSFGIVAKRSNHRRGPYRVSGLHMTQTLDKTQPLDLNVTEVFKKEAALESARRQAEEQAPQS